MYLSHHAERRMQQRGIPRQAIDFCLHNCGFKPIGTDMKGIVKHSIISTLLLLLLIGCATERYISPTITTPSRTGLNLMTPVLTADIDGRTAGANQEAATLLQSELTQIYGSNLQWTSYFEAVPEGRVAIKIRIVTLGSSFGSRLISSASYATAIQSAQFSATGPWGPVVGTASGSTSVFGGSFSGEGWWNGGAWIDVEIQDNQSTSPSRFTIPLVAEHRESNMWGYPPRRALRSSNEYLINSFMKRDGGPKMKTFRGLISSLEKVRYQPGQDIPRRTVNFRNAAT